MNSEVMDMVNVDMFKDDMVKKDMEIMKVMAIIMVHMVTTTQQHAPFPPHPTQASISWTYEKAGAHPADADISGYYAKAPFSSMIWSEPIANGMCKDIFFFYMYITTTIQTHTTQTGNNYFNIYILWNWY